jgi:pimeloyl-ACP methyl ester carboxylesterase
MVGTLALTAALTLASGCAFRTLKKDLAVAGKADEPAAIYGRVATRGGPGGTTVVAVHDVGTGRIAALSSLVHAGEFFFALPAGTYQVAAFEDRNRDLTYQVGEPAGLLGAPTSLVLQPGARRIDLELVIDANGATRIPFAITAVAADGKELAFHPDLQVGMITKMNDPRFSDENAKLGLWNPVQFLSKIGAGVYFLEEYDPKKIPVLFVHGAMGHPGNWKHLVGTLDRSRFQPWLVYYPTAAHLDRVGRGLVRTLGALDVKYGFPRLVLVAHSMGGLVTRTALNYGMATAKGPRPVQIPAFLSISSPWNGHTGAAEGVKYAPVVAPSWEDMAPDSPFLQALPKTPLPPECEYSLFFSYRGGSDFSKEANDGTVTVASELSMPIQRQARHVMGFDESHTSILENDVVAEHLNAILLRAAARSQAPVTPATTGK